MWEQFGLKSFMWYKCWIINSCITPPWSNCDSRCCDTPEMPLSSTEGDKIWQDQWGLNLWAYWTAWLHGTCFQVLSVWMEVGGESKCESDSWETCWRVCMQAGTDKLRFTQVDHSVCKLRWSPVCVSYRLHWKITLEYHSKIYTPYWLSLMKKFVLTKFIVLPLLWRLIAYNDFPQGTRESSTCPCHMFKVSRW